MAVSGINAATVRDNGAFSFGATEVGSFALTTTGAVTQSGAINAGTLSVVTGDGQAITLGAGNRVQQYNLLQAQNGTVTLGNLGVMLFGGQVIANALVLDANGGTIGQNFGASLKADRLTIGNATASLGDAGNSFSRIDATNLKGNSAIVSGTAVELGDISGPGSLFVQSGGKLTSSAASLVEMGGNIALQTAQVATLAGAIKAGGAFDFAAAAPLSGQKHVVQNVTAKDVVVVLTNVGDGRVGNVDIEIAGLIGGKNGGNGLPDFQSIPTGELNQVTGTFNGVPFGSRDFVGRIAGASAQIAANLAAIASSKEEQEKGEGIQTPAQQAFSLRTNRANYASDVFQQRYEVVGVGEEGRATFDDLSYVADGFWEGLLK
jgi:hypothetical protein